MGMGMGGGGRGGERGMSTGEEEMVGGREARSYNGRRQGDGP